MPPSCGTGATCLSPATHIFKKFFQTGDPSISYGCGYSDLDDGVTGAWRDFVVPGPTRQRTCPAFDEPNGSDPPPTGKPSTGRAPGEYWLAWAELLRKTVGVDPEICVCGARMIVDDAITDGDKIAETLARLGVASTGPPKRRQSTGELDYVYDV